MARPDVDQVDLRASKIQFVPLVKQGSRQHQLDPVEVVVFQQLLPGSGDAGVSCLEQNAGEKATDAVQQLLAFLRISDVPHSLRYRAMGDDLRTLEELIAPN